MNIFQFLKSQLVGEPPLNSIDRTIAKRWVKEHLKGIFPELRHDPRALEKAYQDLSLEPLQGVGKGGATLFEVVLPGKLD